ncbi:TNF receptor-associated factor 3-like [Hydractinia symbiolongicarpus]|uniref:TNF receptor-associated factor 3-like n=1 Tax=Hydractinia symbiolongicarpus TaxID=13093 RepID=UPI0025502A8A|nr:TNF receptor-associated factor 3-like [Hydractinia symbiolongicarpus]
MSGGFNFEVAEEVRRDFYCVICLNLMRNAMQLTCGHGMCKSCLEGLKKSSSERKGFICPTCRRKVDNNSVTPAAMINRIILSVKVKCELVSKGCEWIGELGNMEDHLQKRCRFQLASCSFKHCEKKMERHKLKKHQEKCPYNLEKCQYCNLTFFRSQIQDHHSTCDRYPVKCPNDCSDELMERRTLEYHLTTCLESLNSCEFSSFGCHVQCTRKALSEHYRDSLHHHLSLTLNEIKKEVEAMKIMQVEFKSLKGELKIASMQNEMLRMQQDLSGIKKDLQSMSTIHKQFKSKNLIEKEFKKMREEIKCIGTRKKEVETLKKMTEEFESIKSQFSSIKGDVEKMKKEFESIKSQFSSIKGDVEKINTMNKKFELMDVFCTILFLFLLIYLLNSNKFQVFIKNLYSALVKKLYCLKVR